MAGDPERNLCVDGHYFKQAPMLKVMFVEGVVMRRWHLTEDDPGVSLA